MDNSVLFILWKEHHPNNIQIILGYNPKNTIQNPNLVHKIVINNQWPGHDEIKNKNTLHSTGKMIEFIIIII